MVSKVISVNPNIGIHVNPVEKDFYDFVFISFIQSEMFAVPGRSANNVPVDGPPSLSSENGPICLTPSFAGRSSIL
jgi:hypothetical protein